MLRIGVLFLAALLLIGGIGLGSAPTVSASHDDDNPNHCDGGFNIENPRHPDYSVDRVSDCI